MFENIYYPTKGIALTRDEWVKHAWSIFNNDELFAAMKARKDIWQKHTIPRDSKLAALMNYVRGDGVISDGILSFAYYQMSEPVLLIESTENQFRNSLTDDEARHVHHCSAELNDIISNAYMDFIEGQYVGLSLGSMEKSVIKHEVVKLAKPGDIILYHNLSFFIRPDDGLVEGVRHVVVDAVNELFAEDRAPCEVYLLRNHFSDSLANSTFLVFGAVVSDGKL